VPDAPADQPAAEPPAQPPLAPGQPAEPGTAATGTPAWAHPEAPGARLSTTPSPTTTPPAPLPPPATWPATWPAGAPAGGHPQPSYLQPGFTPAGPLTSRAATIVTVVAIVVAIACLGFGTAVFFTLRHDGGLDRASAQPGRSPTAFPLPTDQPTDDPGDPGDPEDPSDGSGTADESIHVGDIRRFIVERPAGAHLWPNVAAEQPLDLNQAAAGFADPAQGAQILRRYRFKDGYARRWVDGPGNYITVRILRFATAGDGDNFTNSYIDAIQAGGWGEPQAVPGLDRAAAFRQPKPAKTGRQSSLAVGDAGDIVAIVLAEQHPPASISVSNTELTTEFGLL
jgi:hypothetical protein